MAGRAWENVPRSPGARRSDVARSPTYAPLASTTLLVTRSTRAVAPSFTIVPRTRASPRSRPTAGVVTYTPLDPWSSVATCTGSVATSHTSR
jgi:hypothetical protein